MCKNFLNVYAISIHALARRATRPTCFVVHPYRNFNPRSRKESDCTSSNALGCTPAFQSTLSQGERLFRAISFTVEKLISIHALARRATLRYLVRKSPY